MTVNSPKLLKRSFWVRVESKGCDSVIIKIKTKAQHKAKDTLNV